MIIQDWLPPANMLMINTDAACDNHSGIVGLGMVLRDENGNIMLSATARIERISSPLHAEIGAILFDLKWLGKGNFRSRW